MTSRMRSDLSLLKAQEALTALAKESRSTLTGGWTGSKPRR